MDTVGPDEYESLTGITRAEYEDRLLEAVRQTALAWYPPESTEASVDAVTLEGDGLDRRVVMLFRIPQRPDCVFGSRTRIWPPSRTNGDVPTPEDEAERVVTHGVDEFVTAGGLVVHSREPGGVTWLP